MTINPMEIRRACEVRKLIEKCSHPNLQFRPPTENCVGCMVSSYQGGHAVDLPDPRKKQEPQPTPTQS